MSKVRQKLPIILLVLLSAAYFVLFSLPNAAASQDVKMVLIFQPDEAVPLPYLLDMIQPSDSIKQALINFAFYDYYFYGYPYFAVSALTLLPLKWFGQISNIPLVMLTLRQMISVLPMLAIIWILVFLQTGLKSYRAVLLFVLLASIPAVVQNNLWWHPDSLAILFAMLVIVFLNCDGLRFGRFFYLAAAMCGFSAGTKGIGFYFFLAIFVYLLIGYVGKKASLKKLTLAAGGFVVVMAGAYLFANPILVFAGVRRRFFTVMQSQSLLLAQGYEVYYPKGLAASWPEMRTHYGNWPILLAALAACLWGIWRGQHRLLNSIVLAWFIPITVFDLSLIHFKSQYWLPVALPLFSTLAGILPGSADLKKLGAWRTRQSGAVLLKGVLALVVVVQLCFYVQSTGIRYVENLKRAENNPSIAFYDLAGQTLAALPAAPYYVYHDTAMYVPDTSGWVTESIFEVLTYPYIEARNFDILLVMQGRIYDYLNPAVQGIDAENLALGREFYQAANQGSVRGYHLAYRNDFGLVFVKEDLYTKYYGGTGP